MTSTNAGLARKLGYTNVRAYLGGEPSWSEAGYPVYASNDYVATGNVVILDLREGDAPVKGRLPRSVQIAYDELENRIDDIPRNAPVILYSDTTEDVTDAYEDLTDEGLRKRKWLIWVFSPTR